MKKVKKIILYFLLFTSGLAVIFAADNYFRLAENWDANVPNTDTANDTFVFSGRLDLEDSRSYEYINEGYRGRLSGWVGSPLFGSFFTSEPLKLVLKAKFPDNEVKTKCLGGANTYTGPLPEIYTMSGKIESNGNNENIWGDFFTDSTKNSYFCSNKIMYLDLFSDTLGEKEIGDGSTSGDDQFGKQEIYIQGIANINGNTDDGILSRGDQEINKVQVYIGNKAKIKGNINTNISQIYKTYLNNPGNEASGDITGDINNSRTKESYYVYNYSSFTENITFSGSTYINKGKKLIIDSSSADNITKVTGINTILVNGGNIYIKSDIKNNDDSKDILIIIAKKNKTNNRGGNIYIDPIVTNIDAILIADGSLISLKGNAGSEVIQSVLPGAGHVNNLRKQLLIYGRILSSNNIGTEKMPYGADLYENSGTWYTSNEMSGNIYDLGNLRSFNLNYGGGNGITSGCSNSSKLTPIETNQKSWAGRRDCYIDDTINNGLKGSNKLNPLIIENNTHIDFLNPFVLKTK